MHFEEDNSEHLIHMIGGVVLSETHGSFDGMMGL